METYDSRAAQSPEASTDELASSLNPRPRPEPVPAAPSEPAFDPPPPLSDCLGETLSERIAEAVGETFAPGSRKPRHDGFTPERIGDFLRSLAATGIVEHAAASVGVSASAAYAFRNRRQGRAFARMWDAILINRARGRLASELQSRAIAGCVSVRKRDGEIVGEYHYYDNRLAMALLTRLDRLAEKEAASEAHLRALSEDMEDYIDCLARGGDGDGFVEARRPAEPAAEPAAEPEGIAAFARLAGCPDYENDDPLDIDIFDLDPGSKAQWTPDQWLRASRSGFLAWLERQAARPDFSAGPGAPLRFSFEREAAIAAKTISDEQLRGRDGRIVTEDLVAEEIVDWSRNDLARAWLSGMLQRLPNRFWDALATDNPGEGEEG